MSRPIKKPDPRYSVFNAFCDKHGLTNSRTTVPIMALLKAHPNVLDPDDIADLIKLHRPREEGPGTGCSTCSVISKGTLEDFGRRVYDRYKQVGQKPDMTLDDCCWFVKLLYTEKSCTGIFKEREVFEDIKHRILERYGDKHVRVRLANDQEDRDYAVDIIISKLVTVNEELQDEQPLLGLQVKPHSYRYARPHILLMNDTKNSHFGKEVLYVFYDTKMSIINLDTVIGRIFEMIDKAVKYVVTLPPPSEDAV